MEPAEAANRAAAAKHVQKLGELLTGGGLGPEQLVHTTTAAAIRTVRNGDGCDSSNGSWIEDATVEQLCQADNKPVSKVVFTLLNLYEEMEQLILEGTAQLLPPVVIYAHSSSMNGRNYSLEMSQLLPLLQQLRCFADHCRDTIANALQQAAALGLAGTPVRLTGTGGSGGTGRLASLWGTLGRLLVVLAQLDLALRDSSLQAAWQAYKKLVKGLRHEPGGGLTVAAMRGLETTLLELEQEVIAGNLLLRLTFPEINAVSAKSVVDELSATVRQLVADFESSPISNRAKLTAAACLAIVLFKLSRQLDRKLSTRLTEAARKLAGGPVVLSDGLVWQFSVFWDAVCRSLGDEPKPGPEAAAQLMMSSWLSGHLTAVVSEAKAFSAAEIQWRLTAEANLAESAASLSLDELGKRMELLSSGLRLAHGVTEQVKLLLSAASFSAQPLTVSAIMAVGQIVAGLRRMQHFYNRHSDVISETVEQSLRHIQFLLLNLVQQAKRSLVSDTKYTEARLDILSCLILAERALSGPSTSRRTALSQLTIHMAGGGGGRNSIFRDADWRAVTEQLSRLSQLNQFWEESSEVFSFSFLCWSSTELLGVVLAQLYATKTATAIPLVVGAWAASAAAYKGARHTNPGVLVQKLQLAMTQEIQKVLVASLCRDIETELRLTVHHQAGLHVDDRNPFNQPSTGAAGGPHTLLDFLDLPPLELPLNRWFCLRQAVADYLERTFYNLTTVSQADWRTYGEMHQLAASRLGLPRGVAEDHLPAGTLEQGLDLLEVMRNIGRFTAAYSYNLHGQMFVERASSNKHLNTLNVRYSRSQLVWTDVCGVGQ